MKKILLFTDLDGTLLDANNYSFSAAQDAIHALAGLKIPIIPCTSKTHLEVISTQECMGISDPFIVENGSAIFFKKNYFDTNDSKIIEMDNYKALVLGSLYKDVLDFFGNWKSQYNLSVTGLHEMSIQKIMALTGLNYHEAEIAQKRFFSEPFTLNDDDNLPDNALNDLIVNKFRLLIGNRFYHLLGNSDKGIAVKKLIDLFKDKWKTNNLITIGIGDSMNDLEMLKSVDKPVLVKKPGGSHQEGIELENLLYTNEIGPAGWQEAVFNFLDKV
ncbi:MAG: HAD hydrolase family protein [Calditrichaceae bacterium]|nr:HAD hydrolase family protein [Calditrichaceae bacterium]